jgi:hypothetical protein
LELSSATPGGASFRGLVGWLDEVLNKVFGEVLEQSSVARRVDSTNGIQNSPSGQDRKEAETNHRVCEKS